MTYITDFLPYFYIGMPRGFRDEDLNAFKEHLNVSSSLSSPFSECSLSQSIWLEVIW